jgi:hypothetical protein
MGRAGGQKEVEIRSVTAVASFSSLVCFLPWGEECDPERNVDEPYR